MSLNQQLNDFKKQQAKCHSKLSSIASERAGTTSSRRPVPVANYQKPPAAAAPVKFSDDTERLQHINSIRKAPVGAQMKRVIDHLFKVCSSSYELYLNQMKVDLSCLTFFVYCRLGKPLRQSK